MIATDGFGFYKSVVRRFKISAYGQVIKTRGNDRIIDDTFTRSIID